jgi:hypothetical protein
LHPLEIEALNDIIRGSGIDPTKGSKVIDLRLSFAENKRVIREWMKAEGKVTDLRTEIVAEKELTTKMAKALKEETEAKEEEKYVAVSPRKKEINAKIIKNRDAIMKEINDYNPHMTNVTYSTLFAVTNARNGKQKTNVINMGKHGTGKSRGTSDLITKLDISDAVIIRGFMTPKKVYDTLKKHYASTVCFDEAENIMNDEMSMFILRPAMFGGQVSWISSKGEALDSFDFTGTVIANMNHFGVTEAAAAPLFDRCLFNNVNLDNKQIIEKIQSADTYQMNEELWSLIKDKIILIRNEGTDELTKEEEDYVMSYIVEIAASSSVFNKSLSARARARALLVARCLKSLFINFDDKVKELYRTLTKPYISSDDADDICVKLLKSNPKLMRRELAEIISEQKQISERQATRMIRAAIDRGILVAINRTKVVINDGKPITEVSI